VSAFPFFGEVGLESGLPFFESLAEGVGARVLAVSLLRVRALSVDIVR
jgi:hypothetical protein